MSCDIHCPVAVDVTIRADVYPLRSPSSAARTHALDVLARVTRAPSPCLVLDHSAPESRVSPREWRLRASTMVASLIVHLHHPRSPVLPRSPRLQYTFWALRAPLPSPPCPRLRRSPRGDLGHFFSFSVFRYRT